MDQSKTLSNIKIVVDNMIVLDKWNNLKIREDMIIMTYLHHVNQLLN